MKYGGSGSAIVQLAGGKDRHTAISVNSCVGAH